MSSSMQAFHRKKKKPAVRDLFTAGVVPLTGLEPVRCCQRGIFMPHYVAIAARSKRCGLDFIFAIDPRP